ncbi:MAG TPA: glycosyltransferase family 87 protein [Phycisphaeraceae bacterium]
MSQAASHPDRRRWRAVLIALLVAAAGVFLVRAVGGGWRGSSDFALIYAASRTWLIGSNPYDAQDQRQAMDAVGLSPDWPAGRELISLYPPATFVVLSPWAAAPWPIAKIGWIAFNLAMIPVLVWGLLKLGQWPATGRHMLALAAIVLLAGPVHTTFRVGQLSLAATAGAVLGLALHQRGRSVSAGLAWGLATALKPQIAGAFLLFGLCKRSWRACLIAGLTLVGVSLAAIVPMELAGISWREDLARNIAAFAAGGQGDPGPLNPFRFQLINLHVPLRAMIDEPGLVSAAVLAMVLLILLAACVLAWRSRSRDQDLIALSLLALASLMGAYHRYYDAVLLLLPLVWALRRLEQRSLRNQPAAWVTLAAVTILAVPGAVMLDLAGRRGLIPPQISQSSWWQMLILPHQSWALLIAALALLGAMIGGRGQTAEGRSQKNQSHQSRSGLHQKAGDIN